MGGQGAWSALEPETARTSSHLANSCYVTLIKAYSPATTEPSVLKVHAQMQALLSWTWGGKERGARLSQRLPTLGKFLLRDTHKSLFTRDD